MLGLLVLSSHDGTCGGRRSLLLRGDLSSALDIMQRHNHTPVAYGGKVFGIVFMMMHRSLNSSGTPRFFL